MQSHDIKVVFGSCPALARHPRDVHAPAAEQSQAAVDAVVQGILGDFDRVPLDSYPSDTKNDLSLRPELGICDHEGSPEAEEAEPLVSDSERRSCSAT